MISAIDPSARELRLFLSIDIAGSTELKHRLNYSTTFETFRKLKRFGGFEGNSFDGVIPGSPKDAELSARAKRFIVEDDDYHWTHVVERCFEDFHSGFASSVSEVYQRNEIVRPDHERYPWKALGDELIYSFAISSIDIAHDLVVAFLHEVRRTDIGLVTNKKAIRLKSSAWVAGFPVRNRKVRMPMPSTALVADDGSTVSYPYPQVDFLGPDMDIGFRLGKCTWPGMCTASRDLVELLSDYTQKRQLRAVRVGWESFKGVWGNTPYPIYWLELPESKNVNEPILEAIVEPWAEGSSPFVAKWIRDPKGIIHGLKKEIADLRGQLPPQYGIVKPYIATGEDAVPEPHRSLSELLTLGDRNSSGPSGPQVSDNSSGTTNEHADDSKRLTEAFEQRTAKPSPGESSEKEVGE